MGRIDMTSYYINAKNHLKKSGYEKEIEWQRSLVFNDFEESDLLRELGWVIMCSGFREDIVRNKFHYISLCFCDWESAEVIVKYRWHCINTGLHAIGNKRKFEAIVNSAVMIKEYGFDKIKEQILCSPIDTLKKFPYIGNITAFHLAKNLGFPIAKPDRHLVRLANATGFGDVQSLCENIAQESGDPIQVVDIILWRYAKLEGIQHDQ